MKVESSAVDQKSVKIGYLFAANLTLGMRPKLLIQKRIGVFSRCKEQGVLSGSLLFICNPTKLHEMYKLQRQAKACPTFTG